MVPKVRNTLRKQLDAIMIQKLVDAVEPLLFRENSRDVSLEMNRMLAKYGPFDGRFKGFSSEADELDFGMNMMESPSTNLKKTSSVISITDQYLLFTHEEAREVSEKADKEMEDDEAKLILELPVDNWNQKRAMEKKITGRRETLSSKTVNRKQGEMGDQKLLRKNTVGSKDQPALSNSVKFQPSQSNIGQRTATPSSSQHQSTATSPFPLKRRSTLGESSKVEFITFEKLKMSDLKDFENMKIFEASATYKALPAKPTALLGKLSPKAKVPPSAKTL